jgi:signal recognition particle GTPase
MSALCGAEINSTKRVAVVVVEVVRPVSPGQMVIKIVNDVLVYTLGRGLGLIDQLCRRLLF